MIYRLGLFLSLVFSFFLCSCQMDMNETDNLRPLPEQGPITTMIELTKYQNIYYVTDDQGSDATGDGSKEKPWATINFALQNIPQVADSKRMAIFISGGDYSKQTILMKEFVDLYGGFSPESWLRDIERFPTVLSGDGKRRVLIGADSSKLDGFIITSGIIRGKGAALFCDGGSMVISNNTFILNKTLGPLNWQPVYWHETAHDGGAIYATNKAALLIKNNLFVKNKTENGRGAAIAMDGHCRGEIINSVFLNNISGLDDPMRSSDGGAVSIFKWCNTNVENNIFLGNRAESSNDGGAMFVALWSSARIRKNIFVDNYSDDDAGAVFIGGQEHRYDSPLDPMPSPEEFYVSIIDNDFIGNHHGGYNSGAMRFTMEARGEFRNNVVAHSNGIYFQRSEVDVINNTILENFLYIDTIIITLESFAHLSEFFVCPVGFDSQVFSYFTQSWIRI